MEGGHAQRQQPFEQHRVHRAHQIVGHLQRPPPAHARATPFRHPPLGRVDSGACAPRSSSPTGRKQIARVRPSPGSLGNHRVRTSSAAEEGARLQVSFLQPSGTSPGSGRPGRRLDSTARTKFRRTLRMARGMKRDIAVLSAAQFARF